MTGTAKKFTHRPFRISLIGAGGLFLAAVLAGCAHPGGAASVAAASVVADTLAPGVLHRAIPTGIDDGIDLVDVDLVRSPARPAIATGVIGPKGGPAHTPQEWLTRTHALAAVNGGYFGQEDGQGNKQFIGLLVRRGQVRQEAFPLVGQGSVTLAPGRYVRSAFGVSQSGIPSIVWASAAPRLLAHDAPLISRYRVRPWPIWDAIGCGPTLIHGGQIVVTDRRERLASPGPLPRTFVAYDGSPGRPGHFVLGIASAMTFQDLAIWLRDYFARYDGTQVQAAMCLDGGASTQLSYRLHDTVQSPRLTDITVPDAVIVRP